MDKDKVALVQETFKKVETIADAAAEIFYARLFEVQPKFRELFKRDMKVQGQMLMSAIGMAVKGLHNPASIVAAVQNLGARHAGYGVKPEYYKIVGEVLLWTLEKGLGKAFTPDVKQAWAEAYGVLSSLMIDASSKHAVSA